MSLLVISEIFGLFLNSLPADHKYSLSNRETLPQSIQIHLSKKIKALCKFFTSFPKFESNFHHFEKNITIISSVFCKLRTSKEV